MSNFCPVCKSAINDDTVKCSVCDFTDLHREFITKEDGELWVKTVVAPYKKRYEDSINHMVDDGFHREDCSSKNSENIDGNLKDYGVNGKGKHRWFLDKVKKKERYSCSAEDFEVAGNTIVKYKGKSSLVVIPDGIAGKIGVGAFEGNDTITEVIMSDEIMAIGDRAFEDCKRLKKVYISKGVTEISYCAFANCVRLKEVNIPENVRKIGMYAFRDCSISSIRLPQNLERICDYAFDGNSNLTIIDIPPNVIEIGGSAFIRCRIEEVNIPDSVRGVTSSFSSANNCVKRTTDFGLLTVVDNYIGRHFLGVNEIQKKERRVELLTSKFNYKYIVKNGTKTICEYAFFNAKYMSKIEIPSSVIEIGENAFGEFNVGCSSYPKSILCEKNSYAHKYAIEHNIPVQFID